MDVDNPGKVESMRNFFMIEELVAAGGNEVNNFLQTGSGSFLIFSSSPYKI